MEQFEQIEQKPKNKFWKGALCGALAMLVICLIVGGTLILFALMGRGVSGNDEDVLITNKTLRKLEAIQGLIDEYYLYSDEVDSQSLQDYLVKGYVSGLQEPYSVYFDEAETTALFESTSGTFGGIGVAIMQDTTSGLVTFTKIYKDCPGEKAGFKEGDVVYKVNGEDVTGQDLDTIVSQIRGELGTDVEITVIRDGEEYTGTATRALIENDTVEYEMKDGKLGYIQVTAFEDVTLKQFEEALDDLNRQGMKGAIIDLRSNPGGNLDVVVDMVDLILSEGTIVSVKDKNGNGNIYTAKKDNKLNVPLVVLINGYSASASEIFAGAVKDHELGTLVGTTTYGKGIVQNIFDLQDGTSLKITSSEYFTPNGTNIHGIGVKPDVEIEYEYDENNPEYDNQLEKAIEVLKSGM